MSLSPAEQHALTLLRNGAGLGLSQADWDMIVAGAEQAGGVAKARGWAGEMIRRSVAELDAMAKATPMKTEDGVQYPAAAFAYVPDATMPSTWKLRLWDDPSQKETRRQVGMAVAALGAGFRGNKVQIPEEDLPSVKAKVMAAWMKVNPDLGEEDAPSVLKAKSFGGNRSAAGRYAANARWARSRGAGTSTGSSGGGGSMGGGGSSAGSSASAGGAGATGTSAPTGSQKAPKPKASPEYTAALKKKPVYGLADEIYAEHRAQGKRVNPAAAPYVDAMGSMRSVRDNYGADSGTMILAYALSNLSSFRGPKAAAIKAEMKARLAGKEGPLEG